MRTAKKIYKTFHIKSAPMDNKMNNKESRIKSLSVKYLEINFDERLLYKNHVDIQLSKITNTFMQ